jgi:hypothetical protein
MIRSPFLAPLCVLVLASCQNREREELLDRLDDFDTARNDVSAVHCECYEELGFMTTGECLLNQLDLDDADKECIADAFDGREDLGVDYYSCIVPLQGEYVLCLDDVACGTDWNVPCRTEYETAELDCPELPSEIEAAITACLL